MELVGVLVVATLLAGILKGVIGFGGALLLAPVFTFTMGPRSSALLIVGIHAITSAQGIQESKQWIRWKAVGASCASAILAAAVVAPWVMRANSGLLKSVSAVSVILLAALHLSGWRMINRGGWAPSILGL